MRQLKQGKQKEFYRNYAEQLFFLTAKEHGWEVTKRGYPDFICYRQDKDFLILVEVKRSKNHRLKLSQDRFMRFLSAHGIRCYKWSPDNDWMSEKNDRMWGKPENNT
jgi:hypothetical protein